MPKLVNIHLPAKELIKYRTWTNFLSKDQEMRVKVLVVKSGELMVRWAKERTPVNKRVGQGGYLRANNRVRYASDGMGLRFFNTMKYAPYVEWGTGRKANVPPEYRDLAQEWWTHKDHAGMKPKPYFFQAYERVYKAFISEIEKMGFKKV